MEERFADERSTAKLSTAIQPEQDSPRQEIALPTLTVLGHPDLRRIGERVRLGELASPRGDRGGETLAGAAKALLSREQPSFRDPGSKGIGRPLGDRFLSRAPLILEPLAGGDLGLCIEGSPTPVVLDGQPVTGSVTIPATALDHGVVLELARRVVLLLHRSRSTEGAAAHDDFGLIGDSHAMEQVRRAVTQVAGLDVSVLLRGETGTGKELVARALHKHSRRSSGPFVSVNLSTLRPSFAVAELFGARKGAYTGAARDQSGYFGKAQHGTLLLDEVSEAPVEVQAMLLRALETGEVVPMGSQQARRVDVRVISATDADLDLMIADGTFRAPLLHRLAGYSITLPPLRARRDDLGRLMVSFLEREHQEIGEPMPDIDPEARRPWLPAGVVSRLALYRWPGNVRQLRNAVRQLVIDSRGRPVLEWSPQLDEILSRAGPLPEVAPASWPPTVLPEPPPSPTKKRWRKPSDVTEDELIESLRAMRWNLKKTAQSLGISRTSLYALLERSQRVRAAADVPPEEIRMAWDRYDGDLDAMVDELEISERALRQRLKDIGLRRSS